MLRSLLRLAVVSAVAVVAAVPLTASAAGGGGGGGSSNGMTITIGSPITLQSKLLVNIPVTVSCDVPISVDPTVNQPGFVTVTVEQSAKGTVAVGSGGVELDSCSPSPQTFLVQATPTPGPTMLSFHGGPAIVAATGEICDFNFPQTCGFASTPWETTKL